jgi:hypothetical protein
VAVAHVVDEAMNFEAQKESAEVMFHVAEETVQLIRTQIVYAEGAIACLAGSFLGFGFQLEVNPKFLVDEEVAAA